MHAVPNDLRLPWRLRRVLRSLRPDVIHARNWSAWPDIAIARIGLRPSIPLIFSFHGTDRAGPIPWRRRVAFRLLARITEEMFTVSDASRLMLAEHVGLAASRVGIIPNGVDISRFQPAEDRRPWGPRLVVGSLGNLTPVKNHALLIRACAELTKMGVDVEVRIAGKGPEESRLRELARELHLADRLHLSGHVEDAPAFLTDLNIFVLPSDSEAHPNALIEAMACGLPCIASRVGGIPEILGDGEAGRLVMPGDVRTLVALILELAERPAVAEQLGRIARKRVVETYNMERMRTGYAALYQAVFARRRCRPGGVSQPIAPAPAPSVIMLGRMSPATGGMATVMANLGASRIGERYRLLMINNGKTTPEGRPLLAGIIAQASLLVRLVRAIHRSRARLVHIHTCSGLAFWRDVVHLLIARLFQCRVVWHIHGGWFDRFVEQLGPVRRHVLGTALRMGSSVLVLSPDWLSRLEPCSPRARWEVLPNGVPLPHVWRRTESNGIVRFLFLGNLGTEKGVHDLIDATEMARRAGFSGLLLVAGGETAKGQRKELQERLRGMACGAQVRLLGIISGDDKEQALRAADCLVLPSHNEGLPMAVLEGMAYGLPVIATQVGAIPELITEGVEGFLVKPRDVQALADHMLRVERNPELRNRMGQAARRRVEEHYTVEAMANRLMGVYESALRARQVTH
jgi:glycosyltransferase involved in cell wall biosynthesis